jgi:tight adherence protein C
LTTEHLFGVVAAVLASASVGLLAWVGLGAIRRLLGRGKRMARYLSSDGLGDMLAQVPVPGSLSQLWAERDAKGRLAQAGLAWPPSALAGLRWVAGWLALLVAMTLVFIGPPDLLTLFLAGVILTGGMAGPLVWLDIRAERRRAEINRALPDFLDRMALGLEAGLSFEQAFRRTSANFRLRLGDELRRVSRQIDRGCRKSDALDGLVERNPSADLLAFVATVKQAETLGTSLAETLRVQTKLLRARRKRRAEEASRRLPVLIVFPLVLFFLPALLIIYLAPPILHLILGR